MPRYEIRIHAFWTRNHRDQSECWMALTVKWLQFATISRLKATTRTHSPTGSIRNCLPCLRRAGLSLFPKDSGKSQRRAVELPSPPGKPWPLLNLQGTRPAHLTSAPSSEWRRGIPHAELQWQGTRPLTRIGRYVPGSAPGNPPVPVAV